VLWLFGFLGAHRFYFGRPVSGTVWLFTFGLLLLGWLADLFLMQSLARDARRRFVEGPCNYTVAWLLLTFLGPLGLHRLYQRKFATGLLYLCTFGLLLAGVVYDYWTLNQQVSETNHARGHATA
jgi:TM2 domain-containing membrane protein YozV